MTPFVLPSVGVKMGDSDFEVSVASSAAARMASRIQLGEVSVEWKWYERTLHGNHRSYTGTGRGDLSGSNDDASVSASGSRSTSAASPLTIRGCPRETHA